VRELAFLTERRGRHSRRSARRRRPLEKKPARLPR